MKFPLSIIFFLFLQSLPVALQARANTDTLSIAKQFINKKEFKAACKILNPYYLNHPGKLNAQWLYAQSLYWAKKFKKAEKVYEYAIAWHPENYYLRLDYAEKLVDIGEFDKAIPILKLYSAYDSNALDLHLTLAKIAFWKGDYKTAKAEVKKILTEHPAQAASLKDFQNEIASAESPWIKLGYEYYWDTQPLQTIIPEVKTGFFVHPHVFEQFNISIPIFYGNNTVFNAQWLQTETKAFFSDRITVDCIVGAIKLPNNTSSMTGKLEVNKIFFKHLEIDAKAAYSPYLYALADLYNPVMEWLYQGYIVWKNDNSWQCQATFNYNDFYATNNYVYSLSFYGLTPPLKISALELRAGYAYNYNTSLYSCFVPAETTEQIIANWTPTSTINGVYNPYFTPDDQQTHFLILSANLHVSKNVEIGAKGNIPIYATTLNPYLYLNNYNDEGPTSPPNNGIYVAEGFAEMRYYPAEFNLFCSVKISPKVSLRAEYTYLKNNFYSSNYVGLSSQISFWHEK